MIAVVSVPWMIANRAGSTLGPISLKEAPEVDRVYFLIPVRVGFDRSTFLNNDDIEIHYFWTRKAAEAWGDRDVERRLGVER